MWVRYGGTNLYPYWTCSFHLNLVFLWKNICLLLWLGRVFTVAHWTVAVPSGSLVMQAGSLAVESGLVAPCIWDLSSQPGIEPTSRAARLIFRPLNPREVPNHCILIKGLNENVDCSSGIYRTTQFPRLWDEKLQSRVITSVLLKV